MDAKLLADSEALRHTAARLERVGLVVDCTSFSRELRVAFYALQCRAVANDLPPEPKRPPIGFAYPDPR